MRKAIADTLGSVAMMLAVTLPIGCVRTSDRPSDLQPLIAVAGQYALMGRHTPATPTGVCSNCGTKIPPGGGFVGDGRVKVPCPECNKQAAASQCPCGGRGYIVRPDGTRWVCQCPKSVKCKDGKCPTPAR